MSETCFLCLLPDYHLVVPQVAWNRRRRTSSPSGPPADNRPAGLVLGAGGHNHERDVVRQVLVRVVETDSVAQRDQDAGWQKKRGGIRRSNPGPFAVQTHCGLRVLFSFAQERKE